jgi:hypothetical protein
MGNGITYISSEEHFENSKTRRGNLFAARIVHFCPNIRTIYRGPVPLLSKFPEKGHT